MLSFTITTSQNKFQQLQKQVFQIMPTRTGFINSLKFNQVSTPTKILLHTGYDVIPFKEEIFNSSSYQIELLKSYFEVCQRLNVCQLLIHGPDKPDTMKYFTAGLNIIKYTFSNSIPNNSNLKIAIEMPAFCKSMWNIIKHEDIYDFTLSYFNEIIKVGFDIIIDTAHLFSNGLTTQQIIDILELFKNNYTFIHLNGNSHDMYKPDKHTTLTPCEGYETNLIPNSDKLLEKVSDLMNKHNKICISEQKCTNVEYFNNLAKQYNFKLNDSIGIDKLII